MRRARLAAAALGLMWAVAHGSYTLNAQAAPGRRYALVLANPEGILGPNLQRAKTSCAALRAATPTGQIPCGMDRSFNHLAMRGVPLSDLVGSLNAVSRMEIVDKTGLAGDFDYDLTFTPEHLRNAPPDRFPQVDRNGPSLFEAVQQQLGLRLEPLN